MLDAKTITILLNLPGVEVDNCEVVKNEIRIACGSIFREQICPSCLKKTTDIKKSVRRTVRDLPLLGKEVYLEPTVHQYYCEDCNRYFNESFEWLDGNHPRTKRLERYLYECCRRESLEGVAARENIGWNSLQDIFSPYSRMEIREPEKKTPERIGIDEFAIKKGKKDYAVVLVDLDKGIVLDILPCRDKDFVIKYFKSKGEEYCKKIKVFSCDMWEGFSSVAKIVFPNAEIVIDRFHFFQNLHSVLDRVRRDLRKKAPKEEGFKSIKWLLYKPWAELCHSERRLLLRAFRLSPILKNVYFLKNELRNIFESNISKQQAQHLCEKWLRPAFDLNNKYLNTFLNTFNNWKDLVLNFFTHRVSNGMVEGINNLIKMIKRQAFGFRNFDNLRSKVPVFFS